MPSRFGQTHARALTRRSAIGLAAGGAAAALLPPRAGAWEVVKSGNREYVTFASLQEFYEFRREERGERGEHAWLRNQHYVVKAVVGSQSLLINETRFILSYPILRSGKKLLISKIDLCKLVDPVLRPHFIRDGKPFKTVILDAGHGGHDSGATSAIGNEKTFALQLAKVLAPKLKQRGFGVTYTREGDKFLSLSERVRIANKIDSAVFLSLHFNSGPSGASGIETFALSPYGTSSTMSEAPRRSDYRMLNGNERDGQNIALATAVHASVLHKIKSIDRGIKRARWAVLTGINKPAVLFEGGFLTHPIESRSIASAAYQDSVADALARAMSNYRRAIVGG